MWRILFFCSSVLIVGCAVTLKPPAEDRSTAPEDVLNTVWQWEETDATNSACVVSEPERYTLRLLPDGRVQARFDCNAGGGSYTMSAGRLSFGPLISTRRACPPDSLDGRYRNDLERVAEYCIQQGVLYLVLTGDRDTMRFVRADGQSRQQ